MIDSSKVQHRALGPPSYRTYARPAASAAGVASLTSTASPRSNKLTLTLAMLYVFIIISRVLDLSPMWWMRIPLILLVALVLLTLARGSLRLAFSSNITRYFAAFTVWIVVCFPFSYWRGASVDTVRISLEAFALFVIIVQVIRSEADWRRMAGAYAYAALVAGIYGFFFGRYVGDRLSLIGGTLADPNELALILLVGLPFWWLKANLSTAFRKPLFWLCSIPVFVTFAQTGSRAGLLAFLAIVLTTFFLAKAPQKVLITIVTCVGFVAAGAFLPGYLKARYFTLFAPPEQVDAATQASLGSDIASSEGRKQLLIQSIHMTLHHPLFGVGPGVFSYAAWDERHATQGAGGLVLVTHNTYTQISSETGLPGFIFFVGALYLALKYTLRDYRAAKQKRLPVAQLPRYLLLSFSGLAVGIFFLSLGYSQMIAIFLALAASLHNVLTKSLSEAEGDSSSPDTSAKPSFAPAISTPVRKGPSRSAKDLIPSRRPSFLGSRGRFRS